MCNFNSSKFEDLLSSYLYSCQPVTPTVYSSTLPKQPHLQSPVPLQAPLQAPLQPFLHAPVQIPLAYYFPQQQHTSYSEPSPSIVIHHKPSSIPTTPFQPSNPPKPTTSTGSPPSDWKRTPLSNHALLDALTSAPLTTSSSKPRKHVSTKPYTNPRTCYSTSQLEVLELHYSRSTSMEKPAREVLAAAIGVQETSIRTWFQNKRARERRLGEVRRRVETAAQTGTF